uniref:Uncharacterized protein n=1 Tax=Molossus molossus TaxID=27622 RepID=A0A7J8HZV1_MOLMO|nr:hypothetical protein HJG59_010787 [Molossus molossus]
MRAHLWAMGQITQAYRRMRRQHPPDHRQDAQLHAEHPEKRLIRTRSPGTAGLHPPQLSARSLHSGMSRGLLKTPPHSFFRQMLGSLSPQEHWFAAVRRSRLLVPLKSSCLCVQREGKDHLHRGSL